MFEPDTKTRVFISYSRKDAPFAKRLASSLDERGFLTDWDQADADPGNVSVGISAEDQWWTRLQEMISAADVVVFLISPNSVRSKVCDEEVAFAHAVGKRVIAVMYRSIEFDKAPPRLAALNVKISFIHGSDFQQSVEELSYTLSLDVGWVREATRIAQEARRWDAADRERDRLFQGAELQAAESWAARRPVSATPPTELVLEFLDASRAAEEERRSVSESQRLRFQEIDRVARVFFQEELDVRESVPLPDHPGIRDEMNADKELIRSLLGVQVRWHPEPPRWVANTGPMDGYAEIFSFPCCGRHVKDFRSMGDKEPPTQFRTDGCREIPTVIQYESLKRTNPFESLLVKQYRRLKAQTAK